MTIFQKARNAFMAASLAFAAIAAAPSMARAEVHACVTRSVSATFTGTSFMQQTVCNAGEFALSAGGFCSAAGDRKGVSTTAGTTDRLVWLQCNQTGSALWYAVCCQP
jgi:hypothetical protein